MSDTKTPLRDRLVESILTVLVRDAHRNATDDEVAGMVEQSMRYCRQTVEPIGK